MDPNILVFDTVDDFNTLNNTLNTAFGFPNGSGTETYAVPVYGVSDTACAMVIEDICVPYLTQDQINSLTTLSALQASGWFRTMP